MMSDQQRIAEHWNATGAWMIGRGIFWLELPSVQRRMNLKVSGQSDIDWVRYTLDRHCAGRLPLGRCLSLGCGEGWLERHLASLGAFVACDGYDVADVSIRNAQQAAAAAGYDRIHYAVADVNNLSLPRRAYDVAWVSDAAHHFKNLEHVFQEVAAALRPGGLFVLKEYVGPNRFQFPARQRELIGCCHALLPVEYRRMVSAVVAPAQGSSARHGWRWTLRRIGDKLADGNLPDTTWRWLQRTLAARSGARPVKTSVNLPTARSVTAIDPSEAVRSAEILSLLRRYFEVVEYKPLGGSLLQFLLADIAGNFQDEVGTALLEALFGVEDALMASGDLASDFVYVVAAPRELSE